MTYYMRTAAAGGTVGQRAGGQMCQLSKSNSFRQILIKLGHNAIL